MAGKSYTTYSDNPKLDTSGVSASVPRTGYDMRPLPPEKITGGKIYIQSLKDCGDASITGANLKKAASMVSKGYSIDHAADIVAKENILEDD
jgi:hypothetical protein